MTDYLTVADVPALHDILIARQGGSAGLRDPGWLEAAIFRPQTGYYADLIGEAAALWESLPQSHAFVDGNKRVAFAATISFLAINGVNLEADAEETLSFLLPLYETGTLRFEALDAWLRERTRPQSGPS